MATLYVTEFATMPLINGILSQIAPRPGVTSQTIAITGASVASAAFNAQTRYIRVHADAICSTAISTTPVATATNERMAADQTEYWAVQPGDKIAVISNT